MRLNAINPADNPMEELLYCFGGDGGGGDDGGGDDRPTTSPAQRGGLSSSAGRDTSRDAERDRDIGSIGGGGRGDSDDDGFDAFDASGDYVSQSIASFQSPSVGVMATPVQAAIGGPFGTETRDESDGFINTHGVYITNMPALSPPEVPVGTGTVLAPTPANAPTATPAAIAPTVTPAAIAPTVARTPAPSLAPNLVNQPLTVGGAFSMPYDSYQRSPQQMFGYGGLTASPYSPNAISFAGGQAARSYDPLGGESLSVFDMGRSPQDYADRSFFDRAAEAVGGRFGAPFQEQRAGFFDPATGTFRDVGGTSTLEKTSENPISDAFGNLIAGRFGSTVDTATYAPLVGGEEYQYSDVGGLLGLLSDGPQMIPMSEIEARAAEMSGGDGGDGGSRQPLIIPTEEEDEQTAGPTEFPPFRQREYEYTPFTSNFYTIPQRFRRF